MSKTVNFAMFILGAAIGSVVTWKYIEHKYEQITQKEINSVKEVFLKKRLTNSGENENLDIDSKEELDIVEYETQLQKQGYINSFNGDTKNYTTIKKEEVKNTMNIDKPYIIVPDDFGEFDEYEKIGFTYYADHILTDDNDDIVKDIESVVGIESLNHFGEYEEDSVFVRNDKMKCDYEILLDQRRYSDIVKMKPHEVNE